MIRAAKFILAVWVAVKVGQFVRQLAISNRKFQAHMRNVRLTTELLQDPSLFHLVVSTILESRHDPRALGDELERLIRATDGRTISSQ